MADVNRNDLPASGDMDRAALRRAMQNHPDVVAEVVSGRFQVRPMDTPITELVAPELLDRLTPAMKKLTKADLMAMGGYGSARRSPSEFGISDADLHTIQQIFTTELQPVEVGGYAAEDLSISISCCCCTPCCCAAAEQEPVRPLA